MKEAEAVSTPATIRQIGTDTFERKDDFWVDRRYLNEQTLNIKYGSKAYLELLKKKPDLVKILSLGDVIFKMKDQYIKISDQGKETLSEKEWKQIL